MLEALRQLQALLDGDTPHANTPEAMQGLMLMRPLRASARQSLVRYIEHALAQLGHPAPKAWLMEAALAGLARAVGADERDVLRVALDVLAQTMSACDPLGVQWEVVAADLRGARLETRGALASGPYVLASANTASGRPEWHCKASLQLWWRDRSAVWVFEDRLGHVKAGTLVGSEGGGDVAAMVSALLRWYRADDAWRLLTLRALESWRRSPRAASADPWSSGAREVGRAGAGAHP